MSADTIAYWNSIPLARPESEGISLKRARPEDDDESDDDISIVSRSPSPPPPDAMDVDKYDEYLQVAEREVITVNTKIKNTNKGFSMLAKMGWVEGKPLGLSSDGRVEPVPFYVKNDLTGLGKTNQDVRMIESTVSQRRELDSERQIKETEEQRLARENSVAKKAAVLSEISTTLRAFYCELCDKQFQNVAQYDEHTNSYAHHHKARLAAQRASRSTQEEIEKRKEKERKREEKELRKIAMAAGVKMVRPPVSLAALPAEASFSGDESKASGFKKAGWATISQTSMRVDTSPPPPPPPEPTRPGWAPVASTDPPKSFSSASVAAQRGAPVPGSSISKFPASAAAAPSLHGHSDSAPSFRTGGWTSLDTNPSQHVPPPPAAPPTAVVSSQTAASPPPPMSAANSQLPHSSLKGHNSWSAASTSTSFAVNQVHRGSQSFTSVQGPFPPSVAQPAPPVVPHPAASSQPSVPRQEASRSGWQKFRAGAPGRRK